MSDVLKIGLIGCGTVGQGVVRIIRNEADEIARKTGVRLELAKVADKDPAQPKKVDVPNKIVTTDAADVFADPDVNVVVELVGGTTVANEIIEGGRLVVPAVLVLVLLSVASISWAQFRMAAAFRAAGEAILLLDAQGRPEHFNAAFVAMTR